MKTKKVKDIVRGQVLESITPGHPIIDALHQMEGKRVSALLVFDKDHFLGIVTMVDIATAYYGQSGGTVADIMTPAEKVVFVNYDDGLRRCSDIMKSLHIHHLVVRDAQGVVGGVVSSLDLMYAEDETREDASETARNMPAN